MAVTATVRDLETCPDIIGSVQGATAGGGHRNVVADQCVVRPARP